MTLKFATFNANSVRSRLSIILDWMKQVQPDILCLQETKAQDKDFPSADFEAAGFHVAFRGQKSYNGVAIVSPHPILNIRKNLLDSDDEEARFMSAEILGIPVINVYVPQGSTVGSPKFAYKLQYFKDLLSHIRNNYDPAAPLMVTGDFNVALEAIDLFDPEKYQGDVGFHPDEQAMMKSLMDWGLADVFRKHEPGKDHYTFWDYRIPNGLKRNLGWRIDYILATAPVADTSQKVWIDKAARALFKPSDHTFLVAEFS